MKKRISLISIATLVFGLISVPLANAGSWCNNGKYSTNSGRGTCSSNGGVNKSMPSYSDPGSTSYNRQNGLSSSKSNNSFGSSLGSNKPYGSSLGSNKPYGSSLGSGKSYGSSLGSSSQYCSSTNRRLGYC